MLEPQLGDQVLFDPRFKNDLTEVWRRRMVERSIVVGVREEDRYAVCVPLADDRMRDFWYAPLKSLKVVARAKYEEIT